MSLNCSQTLSCIPSKLRLLRMQLQQSNSIHTMTELDNNYNADLLDAMADIAYQQEQAMRESNQSDWELTDYPSTYQGD